METTNQNEMGKFIKIIIIVVIIFLTFYLLTILTTGRKKGEYTKRQSTPAIIQYEEIIMGNILNQKESSYYILIKEKDDPYITLIENLLQKYKAKENGIPYYTVDLSSAFNQKYIGENTSYETGNIKVKGTTLLKITDHTIVEHYENIEDILNTLKAVNQ